MVYLCGCLSYLEYRVFLNNELPVSAKLLEKLSKWFNLRRKYGENDYLSYTVGSVVRL